MNFFRAPPAPTRPVYVKTYSHGLLDESIVLDAYAESAQYIHDNRGVLTHYNLALRALTEGTLERQLTEENKRNQTQEEREKEDAFLRALRSAVNHAIPYVSTIAEQRHPAERTTPVIGSIANKITGERFQRWFDAHKYEYQALDDVVALVKNNPNDNSYGATSLLRTHASMLAGLPDPSMPLTAGEFVCCYAENLVDAYRGADLLGARKLAERMRRA